MVTEPTDASHPVAGNLKCRNAVLFQHEQGKGTLVGQRERVGDAATVINAAHPVGAANSTTVTARRSCRSPANRCPPRDGSNCRRRGRLPGKRDRKDIGVERKRGVVVIQGQGAVNGAVILQERPTASTLPLTVPAPPTSNQPPALTLTDEPAARLPPSSMTNSPPSTVVLPV